MLNPGLCLLMGRVVVGLISGLQGNKVTPVPTIVAHDAAPQHAFEQCFTDPPTALETPSSVGGCWPGIAYRSHGESGEFPINLSEQVFMQSG